MNAKVYSLLKLFEIITRHGQPTSEGKALQGITVSSDADGYQLEFRSNGVRISIGFHNTYLETGESKQALSQFFKKADRLLKSYEQQRVVG
ncbi:DUF3081 family protein [Motiliproteus sediminis]|uniref:DUF3081 family protein n=1 Tax=Motiliproteus sediminis TaxID=1468178 RepID=UPI001AEF8D71|nr:DUF3081 family protein [Motiliproteus sediminis]